MGLLNYETMKHYLVIGLLILFSGATYGFAVPVLVSSHDTVAVLGGMAFAFFAPLAIFHALKYLCRKDSKK